VAPKPLATTACFLGPNGLLLLLLLLLASASLLLLLVPLAAVAGEVLPLEPRVLAPGGSVLVETLARPFLDGRAGMPVGLLDGVEGAEPLLLSLLLRCLGREGVAAVLADVCD
jgi:hypothetical protein